MDEILAKQKQVNPHCGLEYCDIPTPHSHSICGCVYCDGCGAVLKSCAIPLPEVKMVLKGNCEHCGKEIWKSEKNAKDDV